LLINHKQVWKICHVWTVHLVSLAALLACWRVRHSSSPPAFIGDAATVDRDLDQPKRLATIKKYIDGNNLGGWSAKHIPQVILQSFQLSENAYWLWLNQLR
jgi:hypothetical protein